MKQIPQEIKIENDIKSDFQLKKEKHLRKLNKTSDNITEETIQQIKSNSENILKNVNVLFDKINSNKLQQNLKNVNNFYDIENINNDDSSYFGIIESIKTLRKLLINCNNKLDSSNNNNNYNKQVITSLKSCIEMTVLNALDRMLKFNVLPLNEDISLVRDARISIKKNSSGIW